MRPLSSKERSDNAQQCVTFADNEPQIFLGHDRAFTFDSVFDPSVTQDHVFETCVAPLLCRFREGYCCIKVRVVAMALIFLLMHIAITLPSWHTGTLNPGKLHSPIPLNVILPIAKLDPARLTAWVLVHLHLMIKMVCN